MLIFLFILLLISNVLTLTVYKSTSYHNINMGLTVQVAVLFTACS